MRSYPSTPSNCSIWLSLLNAYHSLECHEKRSNESRRLAATAHKIPAMEKKQSKAGRAGIQPTTAPSKENRIKRATAKYLNSRDQFSADYINQLIEREKSAANAAYSKYYDKAARALEKAKEAVLAGHAIVDLADPRLSNAILVIQASGAGIKYDTAASLVREFAGDQTALRLLQSVFSGVGANMDGGLSKMIYDPEAAFANATAEIRDHMLSAEGSINRAARAVAVIAKGEGVDFPEQFDPGEIDRAARKGAGLPDD